VNREFGQNSRDREGARILNMCLAGRAGSPEYVIFRQALASPYSGP